MSYTCKPLDPVDSDPIDRVLGIKNAWLEFNPGKCVMPAVYTDIAQEVLDAPVREDDVWLVSFPRTGECKYGEKSSICDLNVAHSCRLHLVPGNGLVARKQLGF